MNDSQIIMHHLHGKDEHDLAIYLTERLIVNAGHRLLDGRWFKNKFHWPGIPDVYFRMSDNWNDRRGRRVDNSQDYIIEIETSLTKENLEKKEKQFMDTVKNCELILVNLALLNEYHYNWWSMEQFIARRLPFEVK